MDAGYGEEHWEFHAAVWIARDQHGPDRRGGVAVPDNQKRKREWNRNGTLRPSAVQATDGHDIFRTLLHPLLHPPEAAGLTYF